MRSSASRPRSQPSSPARQTTLNNRAALPLILMFIVTLLAEGLALNADFYMDDFLHIVESKEVTGETWNPRYPLRLVPYATHRTLYSIVGPSSFAFHCLNFILHFGVVLTVFAVGKLLFRQLDLFKNDQTRERAALVGALVFAAHPFCTEAVNYARCSPIQMVTLFSMLASYHTLRWLDSPNNRSLLAGIAFIILATWSKEPGIFHALINAGLLGVILMKQGKMQQAKAWMSSKGVGTKIAIGAVSAMAVLWVVPKWTGTLTYRINLYGSEYIDHILTQGRMLWGYLGRVVLPINLHSDHHIAVSRSAGSDPIAVIALFAVIALCSLVAVGLYKKRTRTIALLGALVLGHLILRFAYPIHEHFVEYRAYPSLPWVGLIAGLGFGIFSAAKFKPAIATAAIVIALACAGSAKRSAMWGNSALLAKDASEAYELNNRPRCQLQAAAYRSGEYEKVLAIGDEIHAVYAKLIEVNQNHPQKREFDPNRALDDLLDCEQMRTFAITELKGSKAGIEFASERIDHFREKMAPGRRAADYEAEVEKALEGLLSARQMLTVHGAEYDRSKKERQQLSAKANSSGASEK